MAPVSRQIKRSRYRNNSVFEEEKKTISGFSTYRDTYYNPESRLTTGIPKIGSIGRRQGLK